MRARFLLLAILTLSSVAVEWRFALAEPPDQPERKVAFTVEGKTWPEVFAWLKDVTGKPVISGFKLSGKFPCMDLLSREYTIPEVIELINKALEDESQPQKYYLLTRERSFTLVPVDERVDPHPLPRVRPENLKDHDNRELVSVVVPLESLDAEYVAPLIKKVMGPYGDVIAMKHVGMNQLVLLDSVGNLKRICKMLEEGRLPPKPPSDLRRRTDLDFGMKCDELVPDIAGRRQEHEKANPAVSAPSPQRAGDSFDPRTVGARP